MAACYKKWITYPETARVLREYLIPRVARFARGSAYVVLRNVHVSQHCVNMHVQKGAAAGATSYDQQLGIMQKS